jgi:hypothetical protein
MVDEPSNGLHYGGDVAAPVFSQVVQQTLRMMNVAPDLDVKAQISAKPGRRARELLKPMITALPPPPKPRNGWPRACAATCAPTAARAARRRFHRLARPGHRWPALRAGRAGRRCRSLPGGSRRHRGLRLRGTARGHAAGLKAATGAVADTYYAQPSAVLDVVATTGTNGKTSTAWWTAQALDAPGPALRRDRHLGDRGAAAFAGRRRAPQPCATPA